ncbi:immunity 22 family protein [Chryseobacterium gwangjuense]|uniref:immunity 22 family protein n=1 Tax=Chryseobacterium gwangjuense TaxID=1069980 RepID=UPI001E31746D|nr:immunity 22 family protein [Chryseobacterium gwangjuense]MCE3075703.1 immunity 22 family protein [Chryseobacterium gwangjuense]
MNTEVLDFWVGNFNNEDDFYNFVEEDENFYLEEDSDDVFVSKFAESQSTIWFDQDLIEYGFDDSNMGLFEKFADFSFAEDWLPILVQRINETNLKFDINSLLFVSQGQIPKPTSIENDDFSLMYLGGIEFEY